MQKIAWQVGRDTQPRLITSPDRPELPDFSCEMLKTMGIPGHIL